MAAMGQKRKGSKRASPLCPSKRTYASCSAMSVQCQQEHWSTLTLARAVAKPSRLPGATGYKQSASQVCRDPSGRHSFSRPRVTCAQACVSVARELEGNLDVAANTAGCKCKVDRTAELSRDEIANDAHAVSAIGRSCNRRTADLAPCDQQVCRILLGSAVPVHLHPPMRCRQGAVFRSIRRQLM